MSNDTARLIRSEGESLLRRLYWELFMNLAGRRTEARTADIYNAHRELLEPELFISHKGAARIEQNPSGMLISSFLAGAFLGGKCSGLTDRILTLEAGEEFRAVGRKITIRSMKAEILSEPKKQKRVEIGSGSGEILNRLNPLYSQKLEKLTECSEALGFRNYGELIDATAGLGISRLKEEAGKFLKDTDYIAGDILKWFFMKKMELNPRDASLGDMIHLLNSAELRGYFPKVDPAIFSRTVLNGMSLSPAHETKFDTEKRRGKATDAFSIPVNPPFEAAISIYPAGGIQDYESLLGCLGHSLCFLFTEPGDDFEFLFLRDETLTDTFSRLFANMLYEPKWLRKRLKIDTDGDFLNFLYLRRLMSARLDAARALYAGELFGGGETREMPDLFSQIMGDAVKCSVSGKSYLAESLSPVCSPFRFKAELAVPGLRHFMVESFDEEWWRTKAAGDFMRGIWSGGGRITADSLLTKSGCKESDSQMLVRNFVDPLR